MERKSEEGLVEGMRRALEVVRRTWDIEAGPLLQMLNMITIG